jgi:uncharacterized protein
MTLLNPLLAWRFVFPDPALPPGAAGLHLRPDGSVETVQGDQAIRQGLLMLLSILPGERIMRPDYGCDLRRLVFSVNDETTAGLAIHYVRKAVQRWEPRIELLDVDAYRGEDDAGRLDIDLRYRVKETMSEDSLAVSLRMGEEGPR